MYPAANSSCPRTSKNMQFLGHLNKITKFLNKNNQKPMMRGEPFSEAARTPSKSTVLDWLPIFKVNSEK